MTSGIKGWSKAVFYFLQLLNKKYLIIYADEDTPVDVEVSTGYLCLPYQSGDIYIATSNVNGVVF